MGTDSIMFMSSREEIVSFMHLVLQTKKVMFIFVYPLVCGSV